MCNGIVTKPVRPLLTREQEEAKRIASGASLVKVMNMPRLDEGKHGASEVLAGYRAEAISDIGNLVRMIGPAPLLKKDNGWRITDISLNEISLAAEVMANSIHRYLQCLAAGSAKEVSDAN